MKQIFHDFHFLKALSYANLYSQKNFWTAIQPDAIYVVVTFPLTHKGPFPIVFSEKASSITDNSWVPSCALKLNEIREGIQRLAKPMVYDFK